MGYINAHPDQQHEISAIGIRSLRLALEECE